MSADTSLDPSLGGKTQTVSGRLTFLSVCLIFMTGPVFSSTVSNSRTNLFVAAASRQGLGRLFFRSYKVDEEYLVGDQEREETAESSW